jgi:hypothetical protein
MVRCSPPIFEVAQLAMLAATCPAISGSRLNLSTQKSPIEMIETIFPEIGNMADTLAAFEACH